MAKSATKKIVAPFVEENEDDNGETLGYSAEEIAGFRKAFLDVRGRPTTLSDDAIVQAVDDIEGDEVTPEAIAEAIEEAEPTTEMDQATAAQITVAAYKFADELSENEALMSDIDETIEAGQKAKLGPLMILHLMREALGKDWKAKLDANPVPGTDAKNSNNPDKYSTTISGTKVVSSFYKDTALRSSLGRRYTEDLTRYKAEHAKAVPMRKGDIQGDIDLTEDKIKALTKCFADAMRCHFKEGEINSLPHCQVKFRTRAVLDANGKPTKIMRPFATRKPVIIQNPDRANHAEDFYEFTLSQFMRMNVRAVREAGGTVDACEKVGGQRAGSGGGDTAKLEVTHENLVGVVSDMFRFVDNDDNWNKLRVSVQPGRAGSDDLLAAVWRLKLRFEALVDDQAERATKLDLEFQAASGEKVDAQKKLQTEKKKSA